MGIFHRPPLFWLLLCRTGKPCFAYFFCFRDLPRLKLTWDFSGVNILPREEPGGEEVNETRPRGQTSIGGMGPWPGRATHNCLGLEPPLPLIFVSRRSAWPKNTYIKTPSTITIRRRQRNTKHRNRGCSSKDWRGKRCRSHPRSLLYPLRCQHHHHRQWRGSSPPLDYGFVVVDCPISLIYFIV
jgi:hypothetical protein